MEFLGQNKGCEIQEGADFPVWLWNCEKGTKPKGESLKFEKGVEAKGPAILSFLSSFSFLSFTILVCNRIERKFLTGGQPLPFLVVSLVSWL